MVNWLATMVNRLASIGFWPASMGFWLASMESGLTPMVPAARLPGHGVFRTALDLLSDTAGWLTASDYRTLTGRGNLLLLADHAAEAKTAFDEAYAMSKDNELATARLAGRMRGSCPSDRKTQSRQRRNNAFVSASSGASNIRGGSGKIEFDGGAVLH